MAVGAERTAVTDGYHGTIAPASEVVSRQSSAAARTTGRQRAEEKGERLEEMRKEGAGEKIDITRKNVDERRREREKKGLRRRRRRNAGNSLCLLPVIMGQQQR